MVEKERREKTLVKTLVRMILSLLWIGWPFLLSVALVVVFGANPVNVWVEEALSPTGRVVKTVYEPTLLTGMVANCLWIGFAIYALPRRLHR